ncbi:protein DETOXIFICATION 30-like [Cornus florida]|uniref:protein DETOXIFICATION 30-like n=1 Tax=Cornus florida TaxID=4283 RepID=UPI0028986DE8|nr:protein DETOXIFICATION 30-like [Cornus florida]
MSIITQVIQRALPSELSSSSFAVNENDIKPISGVQDFIREFAVESKKDLVPSCSGHLHTHLPIFAAPILILIGQTAEIANASGRFAVWMIPQLFAYAVNFPLAKFLQAQSKFMAMAVIAAVGAAVVLNASWWLIVAAHLLYIFSGSCGGAWSGFSWKAFQNLRRFVKLSLASAVMLWIRSAPVPRLRLAVWDHHPNSSTLTIQFRVEVLCNTSVSVFIYF